jgi:lipopolysaccharide/colanic/teichoic acid biosynthesis glycosyltransferase
MDTRKLRSWILTADLCWAALALVVAYVLRYGIDGPLQSFWKPFSLFGMEFASVAILWLILYEWMRLDGFRGGWHPPAMLSRVFLGVLTLMAILLSVAYLARDLVSRLALAYFGIALFVGFVVIRWAAHLFFESNFASDARRRVVIVGSGRTAKELGARIERHPEILCQVVGYLSPFDAESALANNGGSGSSVSVQTLGITQLLQTYQVEEIILVGTCCTHHELLNLAAQCRNDGIHVSLVPELYELYLSKPNLLDLDGLPVLRLPQPARALRGGMRRATEVVLTSLLVVPAAPIVLTSALLLRWMRGGKAFYWDVRCGLQGRPFRMLRLNVNRNTPNLTVLERLLLELSITELPQLINVLKGDMSLVGPRPEGLDRVARYTEWERQRLTVKPGMTGLAQVHGLREQHSSEDKCRFDLQYLLDPSMFLDLSLLLQTVWTLVARWFRQHSTESGAGSAAVRNTSLLQEILQSAHRTQPSAD